MINCRCQSTAGISGSSVSTRHFRANPQTCPVCSYVGSSQRPSEPINPTAGQNHNETLGSFIEALRRQDAELSPDFLESHETAYDQAFRIFFNSRCHCARRSEVNEPEHTHSLQESVQYLQGSLPPLSTVFGEAGSYDPSSFLRQWKDFLASKPSQPLSFRKSQMHLLPPDEPELLLSRQWDIDSIWFGATGLQAIRPPNDFRLSFLPSLALNLSRDEVIQPHGLELAKTRHIKFGTFNTHSVRFSAFLFFPNAAPDSTSATRNALSLERQKDLYDHIIIPAAYEAVSDPCRQEIPRTYDMAYAKSRSFQEKPGNNRWKPDDVSRAVHLQYTIPAEDLPLFWNLVVEKANSFQLTTKSGELVSYFKDPRLLFQSHDLKNTFGKGTLSESLDSFEYSVLRAFDPAHLDVHSCWIDIGARDYVASVPPHDISGRGPFTVLWKSQCHSYLHEQLSKIAPRSHLNAVDFQRSLLRDIGDYQAKAKRTRASNPGHPHERKPGVIRAKAYSCHKELFSVMFSDYDLFGLGFLPLLALDEGMINDLSSATGNQGRHQAPNTTQVRRDALLKAWEANKRHLRATSDARALANYGIRKEMTFRLDVIVRMWHRGYFEPNQSPHVGHRSFKVSGASSGAGHDPFWVVSTKDINDLIFTQAARLVLPLDHLFQQASHSANISPPSLILAFYTAQLFCRLLTYALASKERFSYDNWIWLSQWTVQSRRIPHAKFLLERRGLGLDLSIQDSGMLWIPPSSLDWHSGHIALETLIQLYIPRNPFQRGLVSQMSVQRLSVSKVAIEISLRQLLQHARSEFENGRRHTADELVERIICLATEEVARAYHQHMLSKLQLYWGRLRKKVGHNVLPCLMRLQRSEEESAMQTGRIVTAQTIWEIYDEAWTAYIRTHPNSDTEDIPGDVPLWMGTRKYLPPDDSWSSSVFKRLFNRPKISSWYGLYFLELYQRVKRLWETIEDYAGPFDERFSRIIGNYIMVTFNSDPTKDVAIDRRPGAGYQRATFFRIQYWAPYFSPRECTTLTPWGSVNDHQHRNPCIPPTTMSRAINVTEFQNHSNSFMQLWTRLISHHNQLREAKIRERNRICKQAMECLVDLVGPQWSHEDDLAFIMPWKFRNSTAGDGQREDPFRLPILAKSTRFSTRPNQPTILLPSRHNAMALVSAIESLPQLDQTILRRAKWIREVLNNNGQQYDMRSHFEAKQREMDDVALPNSILRQFLARTEPPQREIQVFDTFDDI
ncbi:uncharacterized protein NECHADRAFT_79762 [Fusarium vanettenii 77-13-4]|uniref:Uncharacterized protein n=1 Tax=Fusarium vanettenii (strain ATCC MYA-4622 / CBS 123669 / FGSC 9596 / NRRL 45880 / 77-13-4) TaxID=660122 RepID=C7ZMG2_FUSV7|nr:uncharacterized protein NECHADRAFT_79762 [Fusarium vanettenii 77-13-4]EEU34796.1 predicted protein [Fusarium vanettenii 77-13-4]